VVKIVLADDHPIVRQGIRHVLETQSQFSIVGEATDGLETIDLVQRLRPHVLILDLMMPALNGLEVTRIVARSFPETRILILTMHREEANVLAALRNGATGYAVKDASPAELVHAICEVTAGRRYLSPSLTARAIEAYVEKAIAQETDPYDTLTTREREILQLTTEGHSRAAIGTRLSISPRTVETHRTRLMRKLNLRTQADLIRYEIRRGILPKE